MQSHNGFYGEYGGQFVPEILIPALDELERAYRDFSKAGNRLRSFTAT